MTKIFADVTKISYFTSNREYNFYWWWCFGCVQTGESIGETTIENNLRGEGVLKVVMYSLSTINFFSELKNIYFLGFYSTNRKDSMSDV